ncbi:MAG: hypothetical protein ACKO14_13985 [Armatimonadota bacterium]
MHRIIAISLATAVLCSGAIAIGPQGKWTAYVETSGPKLLVNDQLIVRSRVSRAGLTPEKRVKLGAERLSPLLDAGLAPSEVTIQVESETKYRRVTKRVTEMVSKRVTRKVNGKRKRVTVKVPKTTRKRVREAYQVESEARLLAEGVVIAIAGTSDAKASGVAKPSDLAKRWESALVAALKLPGLTVGTESLVIPPGVTKVLKIGGVAKGPLEIGRAKGEQSPVSAVVTGGTVTVRSGDLGKDIITLRRGGAEVLVTVSVLPYAAKLVEPAPVEVTGSGPTGYRLGTLVSLNGLNALKPTSGALVTLLNPVRPVRSPGLGKSLKTEVMVEARGKEMIPVRVGVNVPVVHRPLVAGPSEHLLFSNNPENVVSYGQLYHARLRTGGNRVVFHHQNDLKNSFVGVVELINDSDDPSQVVWIGGEPGPMVDPVYVGFQAVSQHWGNLMNRNGLVVTVPPKSRLPILMPQVKSTHTVSGIMELRTIAGPEPILRITAAKSRQDAGISGALIPVPVTDAILSDVMKPIAFVYPNPNKQLKARHVVGKGYAFIKIGNKPITGIEGTPPLLGNYGVVYDIEVEVENPHPHSSNVDFVFEPTAGLTGFVFTVDGRKVEQARTNQPAEPRLVRIRLAPNEVRKVRVKTIPLSGSNYPVQLTVKS